MIVPTFVLNRLMKHALASLLYMAQLTCGYLIMLVIMTYDFTVFLTVIIGLVLGYYLAHPLIVQGMEAVYLKNLERTMNVTEYSRVNRTQTSSEQDRLTMVD